MCHVTHVTLRHQRALAGALLDLRRCVLSRLRVGTLGVHVDHNVLHLPSGPAAKDLLVLRELFEPLRVGASITRHMLTKVYVRSMTFLLKQAASMHGSEKRAWSHVSACISRGSAYITKTDLIPTVFATEAKTLADGRVPVQLSVRQRCTAGGRAARGAHSRQLLLQQ